MIVIDFKDIVGLCLIAAFILFWIGFVLYVNIADWICRKRNERNKK